MLKNLFLISSLALTGACSSERPERLSAHGAPVYNGGSEQNPDISKPKPQPKPTQPVDTIVPPDAIVDEQGQPIVLELVADRSAVRILSFATLLNKLKTVSGLKGDSEPVKLAIKLNQSLGGYNYAAGVQPENKWSNEKMSAWLQVTDLACRDRTLLSRIQASGGAVSFIESAMGRDVTDAEKALIAELDMNRKFAAERKARVLCTAVLSSGEFVSL